MERGKLAALMLAVTVFLTACGGAKEAAVTTEEIVVPEMSSKDILVNSLEYLIEEEPEEETEEAETEEEKQSGETQEEEGEKATVICYGRDMDSGLTEEVITAEKITPDVLLNALARHNIVPLLDTKALSMEEREENGHKQIHLDLSGSFREYLMTMSLEAECIIISSIANTFTVNYDADAVYITVEGETLVTSHAEYTKAVPGYTPGELMTRLMAEKDEAEENGAERKE